MLGRLICASYSSDWPYRPAYMLGKSQGNGMMGKIDYAGSYYSLILLQT